MWVAQPAQLSPGQKGSAVVVAILERDNWTANTDVIVAVDVARRRLTWVPRDLWSPLIRVGKMVLIPRKPKPWWRQQLHRLRQG
ncbi:MULTISPECIES: hypothetical protein [unclassified Mesorhizobium]|uniref:hypothetical protein n=1 Tax=unclassified Mesorhizobium TaxID=325217 RepID=UPI000F75BE2F|nr:MULTISPECIES: hypothetical protein [unclassified Mesorhizobium]AZO31160.1 hypothetical protein EJ071_29760 [Mesorhizobium sp. M1B.F.Ca.ET.045.04.1.1]RWA68506.1 MAG: hypothetical protein EOQ29_20615 [Mesorhizobium sp.]RWA82781.1 MAG: hypothetical protein EOQ30_13665 [Mesorhizobium sp.]